MQRKAPRFVAKGVYVFVYVYVCVCMCVCVGGVGG